MAFASIVSRHASREPTRTERRALDGRELTDWAEPIIADRVREFYRHAVSIREAHGLAFLHRQLWRNLLLDKPGEVDRSRRDLRGLGEEAGLPPGFADALDLDVMEELLDIVFLRYRASRSSARRFSAILMAASADLGAARAV